MYKVSVIIPVYGAEKYIEKCAVSLFEQTLNEIEFVFVDDCSPDNSMYILRGLINKYPHRMGAIKLLRMPYNGKQAAARNMGLENSTGEYITHCDPDDWVEKDIYEKMYLKAKETDADISCVNLVYENKEGQEYATYLQLEKPEEVIRKEKRKFWLPCHLVRRSLIESNHLRFFPGINLWEDTAFLLRAYSLSKKIAYVDDYLYHYNRTNENSTTMRNPLINIRQEAKCTILLKQWFVDNTVNPLYIDYVEAIQFKILRMAMKNNMDYTEWRHLFPELRKTYLTNKNCSDPLFVRVIYLLCSVGISFPAKVLKQLSKIRNKHRP